MSEKKFTLPNVLTLLRILAIPIFLYFLIQNDPLSRLIALLVFALASITDFLDGFIARKYNMESRLGRFLDPLADKFLVVATLLAFYFLDNQIPLWAVLIIIGRDILITLMRYLAIKKGSELKTTRLAKAKTAFQMLSIVLILMIFLVRSSIPDIEKAYATGLIQGKTKNQIAIENFYDAWDLIKSRTISKNEEGKNVFAQFAPYFLIFLTALVTFFSGLRYIISNYHVFIPPYRKITKDEYANPPNGKNE